MRIDDESGPAADHPVTLTGRTVLDRAAAKAGKVTDVLFEGPRQRWAIVRTGPLSGEHFVPLEHTYVDAAGRLIVPLEKARIKHAPRAGRDHVITLQTRGELRDYYGVAA